MNVADYIFENSKVIPDHISFIWNGNSITYSQLNSRVDAVSEKLKELGIIKGQGVAVLGPNSVDFVVMVFSVIKTGAVVLPLPDHMSNSELNSFTDSSRLNYILFNKKYSGFDDINIHSDHLDTNWTIWNNIQVNKDTKYAAHISDPALVRFTSGTTGKSKGVILSHKSIHERIDAANSVLQLSHNDKIIWVLSLAFHFVVSIMLYIKNGCTIIISNNFLAGSILNDINKFKATFLYVSPMHIRLLNSDESGAPLTTIRQVISTSTAISKELCDTFYNKYNIPVSQAYGIIEIGLPVINENKNNYHPGAIGKAVNGYNVAILGDDGAELKDNSMGNLAIRGPGMFEGYLSPPSTRYEIMQYGFFMTGDLAIRTPDGLITVVGRKKSMINVGGNKVFPEEVENVLMQLSDVINCKVSGFFHPLLGECVMAEIQIKDKSNIDTERFYQHCKKYLSSYKVPQKIRIVEELPMTKSGKVKRE